jgi:hypothetical protein
MDQQLLDAEVVGWIDVSPAHAQTTDVIHPGAMDPTRADG